MVWSGVDSGRFQASWEWRLPPRLRLVEKETDRLFSSGIAYGIERASVVEGQWKKIVPAGEGEALLFDLREDSGERYPLKGSTAPHLGDLLERYIAFGEGVSRAKPVNISPEKLKELQALGYLEGQ